MAHNKTLAAQLYSEFKEFFPHNAVEYFVSYYDYYQPEAYLPRTDTYIEKDSQINDEIDRLRLAATSALLSRRDVVIVASVSCIYGLGDPAEYGRVTVKLRRGELLRRELVLRQLVDIFYERNDMELRRGQFRVRGDTLEVMPAYADLAYRIEFFGDEVERITEIDPLTGEVLRELRRSRDLPGQALHHAAGEADRGDSQDRSGAGRPAQAVPRGRASCWRRSAWSSGRATTWRCCARSATAPASRTTAGRYRCARPAHGRGRCWTTSRPTGC